MPITVELKNVKKFGSVGFTHEQSETLAETIEQAQVDGQEGLKEFIHSEIKGLRTEFNSKIDIKIDNVQHALYSKIDNVQHELNNKIERILNVTDNIDIHIKAGQYDLLIKILAIVVGSLTVAVTILKLFP